MRCFRTVLGDKPNTLWRISLRYTKLRVNAIDTIRLLFCARHQSYAGQQPPQMSRAHFLHAGHSHQL